LNQTKKTWNKANLIFVLLLFNKEVNRDAFAFVDAKQSQFLIGRQGSTYGSFIPQTDKLHKF